MMEEWVCFPESIRQVCRMEVAPKGSGFLNAWLNMFFLLEIYLNGGK